MLYARKTGDCGVQRDVYKRQLVERAETRCPNALIFPITNFMGGKEYDEIVAQLTK